MVFYHGNFNLSNVWENVWRVWFTSPLTDYGHLAATWLDAAKVGLTSIPHRIRTMSCGLDVRFFLCKNAVAKGTVATPVAQPKEDTKDQTPYYDIGKVV